MLLTDQQPIVRRGALHQIKPVRLGDGNQRAKKRGVMASAWLCFWNSAVTSIDMLRLAQPLRSRADQVEGAGHASTDGIAGAAMRHQQASLAMH